MDQSELIPAAQYLRMSTEHQHYSLANQQAAIEEFSRRNGYSIVRSYEDAGKSGLTIRDRQGLQQLLRDVVSGPVLFEAILVYDVSRWGRFQDADEAAHYEFVCRSAGVPVYYCAEQFACDVSVSAAVVKALKRSMAGEYSRELSIKVLEGQKQTALSGFRVGGIPGYGLRRLAVSRDGIPRRLLSGGELKPFVADRVKLVPGPAAEVAIIRRIYRTFIRGRGKIGFSDIASELNGCGIPSGQERPWTRFKVREVLRNPKYAGALVWSKSTQKLRTRTRPNLKRDWIINKEAYEPIIDQRTFARAQVLFKVRLDRKVPERELLRSLKRLLAQYGSLSEGMLRAKKGEFGVATYYRRLGTIQRIYDLLKVDHSSGLLAPRPRVPAIVNVRNSIILRFLQRFPNDLSALPPAGARRRSNLLLDGRITVFVWIAVHYRTKTGKCGWRLNPPKTEKGSPVLLCSMKPGNKDYKSLYLFTKLNWARTEYTFGQEDSFLKSGRKLASISELCSRLRRLVVATESRRVPESYPAFSLIP
jgi:DNA invertase Pin-like site-specific DNA recombinase